MSEIDSAAFELREMDELASGDSPVHRLHPLAKLIITISYIFICVSFDKYNLSGIVGMVLYPVIAFQISGVPVRLCFHKLRYVLPLVCAVGIFNPVFDRTIMLRLGTVPVSAGTVSMLSLMLKGVLCLMASFLLAATSSIDSICASLRMIKCPQLLTSLLLLTYRYISVMIDEVAAMTTAYRLRAPGQKGLHFSTWGSFLGQLLLRSMDRAEELYSSMQMRGFRGEFFYAETKKLTLADCICMLAAVGFFLLLRYVDLAQLIGGIALGGLF